MNDMIFWFCLRQAAIINKTPALLKTHAEYKQMRLF